MNRQPNANEKKSSKKKYAAPKLVEYGNVRQLTQTGSSGSSEGSGGTGVMKPAGSDRVIKENIAKIGVHPLGIGLYLFDYKSDYRDQCGHGRQFGVMADEVETVMPEAVSVHADGYKQVDYSLLGVTRNIH